MELKIWVTVDVDSNKVNKLRALNKMANELQMVMVDDDLLEIQNAIDGEINSRFTTLFNEIKNQLDINELTQDFFEVINND